MKKRREGQKRKRAGRTKNKRTKNPMLGEPINPSSFVDALGPLLFGLFGCSAIRAVGLTPLQAMVAIAKVGAAHKAKTESQEEGGDLIQ